MEKRRGVLSVTVNFIWQDVVDRDWKCGSLSFEEPWEASEEEEEAGLKGAIGDREVAWDVEDNLH